MPYVEGAPDVPGFEDLVTHEEMSEILSVNPLTLTKWRYVNDGKPTIPTVIIGRKLYYSKTQMLWWLNLVQKQRTKPIERE